jgi:hypothetical protein
MGFEKSVFGLKKVRALASCVTTSDRLFGLMSRASADCARSAKQYVESE